MGSDLVAGVDLGGTSLLCVIADAQGKVRGEAAAETIRGKGADKVIDQVVQVLDGLMLLQDKIAAERHSIGNKQPLQQHAAYRDLLQQPTNPHDK